MVEQLSMLNATTCAGDLHAPVAMAGSSFQRAATGWLGALTRQVPATGVDPDGDSDPCKSVLLEYYLTEDPR